MKKIILILVICFPIATTSFAQSNVQMMRFLTINALMRYGQKLYDRGDFDEATSVFNHVLNYDHHQAKALKYLKEMGHLPPTVLAPVKAKQVEIKTSIPIIKAVDLEDTESIKQVIEAKKLSIAKLQDQIKRMRDNIAAQSPDPKLK